MIRSNENSEFLLILNDCHLNEKNRENKLRTGKLNSKGHKQIQKYSQS